MLPDVDINFGADAEFSFQVDTRLNREAGARDDAARVACFQIVYVRAVAVNLFAYGMARAVYELLRVACATNHPQATSVPGMPTVMHGDVG